jgi:hypothetical protein
VASCDLNLTLFGFYLFTYGPALVEWGSGSPQVKKRGSNYRSLIFCLLDDILLC